jgi:hypothetical protein
MSLAEVSGVTVIDVMRELRVELTSGLSWTVGARVREIWLAETGTLPDKVLRPKTNDGGTHCFAVYPDSWRPRIARVIGECETEAARQGRFDF